MRLHHGYESAELFDRMAGRDATRNNPSRPHNACPTWQPVNPRRRRRAANPIGEHGERVGPQMTAGPPQAILSQLDSDWPGTPAADLDAGGAAEEAKQGQGPGRPTTPAERRKRMVPFCRGALAQQPLTASGKCDRDRTMARISDFLRG